MRQAIGRVHQVINLDALTYAAWLANVAEVAESPLSTFEQVVFRDRAALDRIFATHTPDLVMHLAAESHVDRLIDGPADFIETNIVGTFNMPEAVRKPCEIRDKPKDFRFHHISTTRRSDHSPRILQSSSQKRRHMIRVAPTLPARPVPIIWCAPGTRPTACRSYFP
ncbi:NAD-dependent epimerase/dehydratase family protein [Maritimibacter sp. DP07]|uniref:NAD-dependent epimerase/dehydratase family protein n=1 Tax=Maritimibacter harenae TaxID=2606218 RepID=A0A845M3M4_9RHOB|nr:NAD-dependent epimerase/dehydratase family protein [Maritimibacter harenae]